MHITDVNVKCVSATLPDTFSAFTYGEKGNRMAHPADIHFGFAGQSSVIHCMPSDGKRKVLKQSFVEVHTDEGITGIYGPIGNQAVLQYVKDFYGPIVIGLDPLACERIWDIMFRMSPRAYAGEQLFALSAVDNAIWDVRCKVMNLPLYQVLGGPTREKIMVYANCAGLSYEPTLVRQAVLELKKQGYRAMKWYAPYGPGSGEEGFRKNVKLLEILRETGGEDLRIMLDVWSSWDLAYAMRMGPVLHDLQIYFVEEPLMPSMADSYIRLANSFPIPVAFGENLFLRWGFKRFLDAAPNVIFQPDPEWCGGITETKKIIDLISSYGSRMCMHASSTQLVTQMSMSTAPDLVDMVEYLVTIAPSIQYFLKTPMIPENGFLTLPKGFIGTGHDIDESKVDLVC